MLYLGIDPGFKGAICFFDPIGWQAGFIDLNKPVNLIHEKLHSLNTEFLVREATIEDVHSLYGMSAKSNFSFGYNVGMINTLLLANNFKVNKVQPKVWQKAVGVTCTGKAIKNNVADLCKLTEIDCDIYGPKGGLLDGRSDSLMIAYYAYLEDKK